MTILIASQVGMIRRSLQQQLEQAGHKVVAADSPVRALECLRENSRIAVVVVEWRFSEPNATELQRQVSQIDRLADDAKTMQAPHFIILATPDQNASQTGQGSMVNQARAHGFDDVFEKPIDRTLLLNRIQEILTERNSGTGARPQPSPSNTPVRTLAPPERTAASANGALTTQLDQLMPMLEQVEQASQAAQTQIDRLHLMAQQLRTLANELRVSCASAQ